MHDDMPLLLWRIAPTVLFLGVAVPLYLRAMRGVIPADPADGFPEEIRRADSPKRFWTWMSLYLLIAVLITVWFIAAWTFTPSFAN